MQLAVYGRGRKTVSRINYDCLKMVIATKEAERVNPSHHLKTEKAIINQTNQSYNHLKNKNYFILC